MDEDLLGRWTRLLALREVVNVELERLRQDKTVGTSLEAQVEIQGTGATAQLLDAYRDFLPTLFITSEVVLTATPAGPGAEDATASFSEPDGGASVRVSRTTGVKCARCWRYVPEVSTAPDTTGVCERCVEALSETVGAS